MEIKNLWKETLDYLKTDREITVSKLIEYFKDIDIS